jgi:hypothetical protein
MKGATLSCAHSLYERIFMRAAFAWVVIVSTPQSLNVHAIPAPNGLARIVDLSFLIDPATLAAYHTALVITMGLYLARFLVWLALPIALWINVSVNAVANSQGAIQHSVQIVSLVLLAQTAAHYSGLWLRWRGGTAESSIEERTIWWSQQTVAAVYLVTGVTKLIVTHGTWIFQARFVGVQILKTAYQAYYDRLDPSGLEAQLSIAQFAAAHGAIVALIAGMGLLLELLAPLMVLGRRWALALGCSFLLFHVSIDRVMHLRFVYHQLLVLIYMVDPVYWIVAFVMALPRLRQRFKKI